jgi:hypothetical protein
MVRGDAQALAEDLHVNRTTGTLQFLLRAADGDRARVSEMAAA